MSKIKVTILLEKIFDSYLYSEQHIRESSQREGYTVKALKTEKVK